MSYKSLIVIGILSYATAYSQIKEEVLIIPGKVDKEIKSIPKLKPKKEINNPFTPENKPKEEVSYTIEDIPAISDFKTTNPEKEDLAPSFAKEAYRKYASLYFGNYITWSLHADANQDVLDGKMILGARLNHLSSDGFGNSRWLNSSSQNSNAAIYAGSNNSESEWAAEAGFSRIRNRYYGDSSLYNASSFPESYKIDNKTGLNNLYVGVRYENEQSSIVKNAKFKAETHTNLFSGSEYVVAAHTNIGAWQISVFPEYKLTAGIMAGGEIFSSILKANSTTESRSSFGYAGPKISFQTGTMKAYVGAKFYGIKAEINVPVSSYTDKPYKFPSFMWAPEIGINAQISSGNELYASVSGDVSTTTITSLYQINPFILPNVELRPTRSPIITKLGLRGNLEQRIIYDISIGYKYQNDLPIFFLPLPNTVNGKIPYSLGNAFDVLYDNVKTTDILALLEIPIQSNISVKSSLNFRQFSTEYLSDMLYEPNFKGSLSIETKFLSDRLTLELGGLFLGVRKGSLNIEKNYPSPGLSNINSTIAANKIPGYADVYAEILFNINKNFSIFASGKNLTNSVQKNWEGYPNLGIQAGGGLQVKF